MPIENSPPRRDGHDHLRYSNDDEDTRYTGAPRRVTRTNPSRQRPTTYGMSEDDEEEEDDVRADNNTQDIIVLEPKSRPTQSRPHHRTTSSHRSKSDDYDDYPVKKTTGQHVLRQPTQQQVPAIRQTTQPREPLRRPTQQQVPAIRQTTQPRRTDSYRDAHSETYTDTRHEKRREFHWLVPFGITLILAIMCYLFAYGAWTGGKNVYNDMTYGSTTRTSNLDAVVGDHDSAASPTHFVALNLHGTINIVEFPGGDVTHAKVYPGPHLLWSDADKSVVTMEVKDVNGDKKPDLVIHVYGDTDLLFHQTTASFVLLNNGSGFAPMVAYQ